MTVSSLQQLGSPQNHPSPHSGLGLSSGRQGSSAANGFSLLLARVKRHPNRAQDTSLAALPELSFKTEEDQDSKIDSELPLKKALFVIKQSSNSKSNSKSKSESSKNNNSLERNPSSPPSKKNKITNNNSTLLRSTSQPALSVSSEEEKTMGLDSVDLKTVQKKHPKLSNNSLLIELDDQNFASQNFDQLE